MIGLSLSFCVADILAGRADEEQITRLVTGTNAPDDESWGRVLNAYASTHWWENPAEGIAIANRFRAAGKVDQPRTRGEMPPAIFAGHWIKEGQDIPSW